MKILGSLCRMSVGAMVVWMVASCGSSNIRTFPPEAPAVPRAPSPSAMPPDGRGSTVELDGGDLAYPTRVHLPVGYEAQPDVEWPLILFLHGAGGLIQADDVIPPYSRTQPGFPFVIATPSSRGEWSPPDVGALLDELQIRYRIDPDRIYLTGISMGAYGAWITAAAFPNRFAALALVAGAGEPGGACNLRHLPTWLFHNRADQVVSFSEAERLAVALERCGAPPRVTIYDSLPPGRWHHNAWDAAYTDAELYRWFLSQVRSR